MRELQAQSLVVKAVKEHGGVAFKMANRFLVGVSDLFVQLPGCHSYLWEVKLAKGHPNSQANMVVNVTSMQAKFIEDVNKSGGKAGVISFVQNKHDMYFAAIRGVPRYFPALSYKQLGRGTREKDIVDYLYAVSHVNWKGV